MAHILQEAWNDTWSGGGPQPDSARTFNRSAASEGHVTWFRGAGKVSSKSSRSVWSSVVCDLCRCLQFMVVIPILAALAVILVKRVASLFGLEETEL